MKKFILILFIACTANEKTIGSCEQADLFKPHGTALSNH